MNLRQRPLHNYTISGIESNLNTAIADIEKWSITGDVDQASDFRLSYPSLIYQELAVYKYYCQAPLEEVRDCFASSAQHEMWLLERTYDGRYFEPPWPSVEAERITCAMVAGRWDLATAMARMIKAIDAERMPVLRTSVFGRSGWMIIHLVLREDEQAMGFANTFLKQKNPSKKTQQYIPMARMALAIVDNDGPALASAMQDYFLVWERLVRYSEDYRYNAIGMMCFPGMAYYLLAKQRQIPLNIEYPYLFLDLLEE